MPSTPDVSPFPYTTLFRSSKLTLAMGRDLHGRIRVTELAAMPHLLIAGSTGTGKSVFINSLMLSILFKASPEDRKSTRLNSSHVEISYAVFCLKKKL